MNTTQEIIVVLLLAVPLLYAIRGWQKCAARVAELEGVRVKAEGMAADLRVIHTHLETGALMWRDQHKCAPPSAIEEWPVELKEVG